MESYEKLLGDAYKDVKVVSSSKERFEIPKIEGFFEGKKTVLTNFFQIASYLRRDPDQIQKYLSKEFAAPIVKEKDRIVIGIKIPSKKINPKIEQYAHEFVICKECNKPDTELIKEGKQTIIHCLACGAKHPVRNKI